jgi:hypothetical protein
MFPLLYFAGQQLTGLETKTFTGEKIITYKCKR